MAFSDYAKFRDAMNATGKQVWFSLCGWESWYSPPDPSLNYTGGGSLGNSWRIAGDGQDWKALTNCMNTQAGAAPYIGLGAWADPDLLIGPEVYVGGQSDVNARAQFSMWSLFPTNLLISQNVLQWSPYALETYSNAEAIAINQDPLGSPARRIVGGDLTFPCHSAASSSVQALPCNPSDPNQQWAWDSASGLITSVGGKGVLASTGSAAGAPVAVVAAGGAGASAQWSWPAAGSPGGGPAVNRARGECLDVYNWAGPLVDTYTCNGGSNQALSWDSATGTISEPHSVAPAGTGPPLCLAFSPSPPQQCTNVWGRQLSSGYALGMVNNGDAPATVTCDSACFAAMNVTAAAGRLRVRDVWAHMDVATLQPPYVFSAVLNASGTAALYTLTPL